MSTEKTSLRILIVDDHAGVAESLGAWLSRSDSISSVEIATFVDCGRRIAQGAPDILVLDLAAGEGQAETPGTAISEGIWRDYFCPIVIYSSFPERHEVGHRKHRFVRTVEKGDVDSEEEVLLAIQSLLPYVEALRVEQRRNEVEFASCLRDAASHSLMAGDPARQVEVVMRGARRRFAAQLDEMQFGEEQEPWEEYLCPPLKSIEEGGNLLTGDLLCRKSGDRQEPHDYRMVLSPSCDLVASGSAEPKITDVLVAKCGRVSADAAMAFNMSASKMRDRLPALLNRGYFEDIIPMPELTGQIPAMVVKLKALELLPFGVAVGKGSGGFDRVASLDSPFRELVSWAYTQTAARLGLPDRDTGKWAEELVGAVERRKGGTASSGGGPDVPKEPGSEGNEKGQ